MAETRKKVEGEYLMYQNKPLVREGDTIIYGDLNTDSCVLCLDIMNYVGEGENKVPGKVLIQVLSTENGQILKQADKEGMFEAFNYGMFWYEKILTEN